MQEVGFEPTKQLHKILSLAPLTTRESLQFCNALTFAHIAKSPLWESNP